MIKKIKYWTCLAALVFITPACDDYLEKYPLEGPSDASFYANQDELMMGLNGCYKSLNFKPSDNTPMAILLDADSDINWDRNNSPIQEIGKGSHDSNNGYVVRIWADSYAGIARCNFLLDNIHKLKDKISPALFAQVTAEARFIRALHYHYLAELFGGVPLVVKSLKLEEAQVPRSTKAELADFIIQEMEEAAADLPVSLDAKNQGRATKGAALAIKARTALYNERWDLAASAAKAVMDLNVYKLHTNYGQLFTYAGQNSQEIIFTLQYLRGIINHSIPNGLLSRMAQGTSNKVPPQSLIDSYESTDGLSIDKSPLYDPKKPFERRDPRLGFTVALPGSNFFNYKFETHKDSLRTWNYNTTPATRVANTEATHAFATYTGYCWRKYTDLLDKDERSNSELNIILVRYAEVLLTYAEAKIEANQIDASVYEALNAVRQRPSVNMPRIEEGKSQAELRSIVRKERKYELAMEGFRLFDIRRWKIAEKVMNGPFLGRIPNGLLAAAPTFDANGTPDYSQVPNRAQMRLVETRNFNPNRDYLWPIPNIEILTNTQLVQNPGY
ncbi:MAG: RagB/SusD family nutrient uptake outer membrane protein [Adhaeribacter sp.]